MLFNSIDFIIFFPIVLLVYFIIPVRFKRLWLLIASYFFYMCWDAKYALLILFVTVVTYVSGILIELVRGSDDNNKGARQKAVVAISFVVNLGLLFYFKYTNFLIDILNDVTRHFGTSNTITHMDIVLPVGISFYTFQALSYTVDVYRKEVTAERNFIKYALFVSFFPQLVAGPIERSKNLLRQLDTPKKFDYNEARDGVLLMLWGFFMKMVIADRVALLVNEVYSNYVSYPGYYIVIASVLFAFQIYCDFAGYSIIAIGAAEVLGVKLMNNFDAPFFSTTIAMFWRRWHISLNSWFKDYLYFPLGGNRKGRVRKYINIMIVFLLSGLWHGASLSYVFWGGLNGLYQVIGEVLMPARKRIRGILHIHVDKIAYEIAAALVTFGLFDFTLIFFRAGTLSEAKSIIAYLISFGGWAPRSEGIVNCGMDAPNFILMIIGLGVLFVVDGLNRMGICIRKVIIEQDYIFRCVLVAGFAVAIIVFGIWGSVYDAANFIYFQF